SILEYLDKSNLFIVSLDDRREWYRYHRLFTDLLNKRLSLTAPTEIPELYRRASEWSEQNGALEDAIDYALMANDKERAANLIDQVAEGFMNRGEFVLLRRWLASLPDEQICSWPQLCVFHAWILLMNNSPLNQIEERLEIIETCESNQAFLTAPLRAYIAIIQGVFPQAAAYVKQALQAFTEGEGFLGGMVSIVSAACELWEGDPQAGYQAFERAAYISSQSGNILASVIALMSLGENHHKRGQLYQAEAFYNQALNRAVDFKGNRMPVAGRALCGLGELLREWNRLDEAEQVLLEGIKLLEDWTVMVNYAGYYSLAMLKQERGNLTEAMEIIQKIQRISRQTTITMIDDWVTDMMQARFCIANGDLKFAQLWAERRGLLDEPDPESLRDSEVFAYAHLRKYEMIVFARLQLAQNRFSEALQILDSILPEVIGMSRLGLRIEIQLLRARAFSSLGKSEKALSLIEVALSLAEPAGYVRIFLDEGDWLFQLLSLARQRYSSSGYISRLLAAFGRKDKPDQKVLDKVHQSTPVHIEELSAREMEVLNLLKSRMTAPEMADMLSVAESTVRSHIKRIYSKLDVHRRIEAIQKAEELGLLG
ncbi:MAG: tetratricopeptide repeat protein, partial [Anaerolineales bacterium]|nr:tetratricopeptide repeat protein [Anaerolineales bacterium]